MSLNSSANYSISSQLYSYVFNTNVYSPWQESYIGNNIKIYTPKSDFVDFNFGGLLDKMFCKNNNYYVLKEIKDDDLIVEITNLSLFKPHHAERKIKRNVKKL